MPRYTIQPERVIKSQHHRLQKQLFVAAGTLLGVTIVSTIGFILTGRYEGHLPQQIIEGLWDTLNLVSTVGNLDELTTGQKIWGMIVITIGLGAVLYGFSIMQGLLHGKDTHRHWEQRKMKQTLSTMKNHIVICGYGHVGRRTAEELVKANLEVVVIEQNQKTAELASDNGFLVIESDATDGDMPLQHAQIENALGLITALPNDASNVYVCMIARELNQNLRIVTRGEYESSRQWLERAGANDVVIPGESTANLLASLLTSPHLHEFFSQIASSGEHSMIEVPLDNHPEVDGKPLNDLFLHKLRSGVVMSIRSTNGDHHFNPPSDKTLSTGDSLLLLVPSNFDCSTPLM